MKVVIPVFEGCSMFAVSGMASILLNANNCKVSDTVNDFEVILAAVGTSRTVTCSFGMHIICDQLISQISFQPNLIVVAGLENDILRKLDGLSELSDWIKEKHRNGAILAGACTGNFILAQTGLLKGKTITTHWKAASCFKKRYPDVILKEEKVLIDHGDIVVSGGTLSFQNMMLYLVSKFQGRETAIALSKFLVMDIPKDPQSAYSVYNGFKGHNDSKIKDVQFLIEENYCEAWNVEALASKASLSVRQFTRRFKQATGQNPSEYIRQVRIGVARHLLESTIMTFDEITHAAGYEDAQSFRMNFKRSVGLSPIKYRNKFTFSV